MNSWKFLVFFLFFLLFCLVFPAKSLAVFNPLTTPNNKVGIHILFPEEIHDAVKLVNANGGEWGYVTIPIQAGEKNIEKWQKFMDDARALRIIPIVRIASEGDYFNTKVWRKPTDMDILDFANFLSSLRWPVKNRYIVVFNEVNRGDEWGGVPNPSEYAQILSYAVTVFKSKSQDFFIISSGMDNAAATVPGVSINQYEFMYSMNQAVPGIFFQVDGIASHSYPNPAFSQPPSKVDNQSIASFRFESELVKSLTGKSLPVFITETGWSRERVSNLLTSLYYQTAFASVWSDTNVVAVTPFLLRANSGPFTMFSFLQPDNTPTLEYTMLHDLPKVKGEPITEQMVLGDFTQKLARIEEKTFVDTPVTTTVVVPVQIKSMLKWFLKMPI
ncbi:MAG: hypothetical protein HYT10_00655 [Candidatus Levybacteria bacterium]|nr:hypothetical protein [Candidatus Levybacteria bacterium]